MCFPGVGVLQVVEFKSASYTRNHCGRIPKPESFERYFICQGPVVIGRLTSRHMVPSAARNHAIHRRGTATSSSVLYV